MLKLNLTAVLAALMLALLASAQQRTQAMGVPTSQVAYRNLTDTIRTAASLAADEATESVVALHLGGWIEQVEVNTRFQSVRRGQVLCTVYSPPLYAAEQDYVFARENARQLAASTAAGVAGGARRLLADARARLEQQQVPAGEIARLEAGGEARSRYALLAPGAGIVSERRALPGMHAAAGAELYAIVQLQPIWAYAAVNESDLGRVRQGQTASLQLDAFPGRTFAARVDFINPQVDAASRTAKVRLVLANADGRLTPGMYGSAAIQVVMGRRLVIPASAVLESGAQPLAFIAGPDGELLPHPVTLGPRIGDDYVLRGGLQPGTRVATDASFLVASEAQLSAAAASYAPPPPGVAASARGPAPAVAAPPRATLTTAPSPARAGPTVFRLRLTFGSGEPIVGAQVAIMLYMPAMPAMGMGAMQSVVQLRDLGGGLYEGQATIKSAGRWQLTITAGKGGQRLLDQHSSLLVGAGPSAALPRLPPGRGQAWFPPSPGPPRASQEAGR
ncbi:MAG: efflux RND transporter periplasmic adaptor subunit [Terriglobales bacterium]